MGAHIAVRIVLRHCLQTLVGGRRGLECKYFPLPTGQQRQHPGEVTHVRPDVERRVTGAHDLAHQVAQRLAGVEAMYEILLAVVHVVQREVEAHAVSHALGAGRQRGELRAPRIEPIAETPSAGEALEPPVAGSRQIQQHRSILIAQVCAPRWKC